MRTTKKLLFEMYTSSPLMFGSLGAKILGESANARELKSNLAYYLEKYECLASQSSDRKYFHGKMYLTTQDSALRLVTTIRAIITFMEWEYNKISY